MPARSACPPSQADRVWKDALDVWLPEFMHHFFPKVADQIDWSKGCEFLDKEFQKLTRKSKIGKRIVDKLVKVYFKTGQAHLVLLHVEVQGAQEADFEKRLFEYLCRLYARYRLPILPLVIFTDDSPSWRPDHYRMEVSGYPVVEFRFLTHKLLENRGQEAALSVMENPFGTVVAAQLAALATRGQPSARYEQKLALTQRLYERCLTRAAIEQLYHFIDGVLTLPAALERRYNNAIKNFEQEKEMRYVTSAERIGRKDGRKEGRQEGRQEGREEGREEGRQEGREEGRQEGREEGKKEEAVLIAQKMLAKGTDLSFIQEVTGLSHADLIALMH